MREAALSSLERVRLAADRAGLSIEVKIMAQSTRTAAEAASACGCAVAQIVKSLVFETVPDGRLVLLLVSGSNMVDLDAIARRYRLSLKRTDIQRVREETGFAIGGVAPLGALRPLETWMDAALCHHGIVYAAAGRPDAVFAVAPRSLAAACNAMLFEPNLKS
ncbi:MAG: YbaK/EbsC family protein [Rhizobiaceae bacterium]|jgi:prolyl-tRNA editing enzyme YbaK/EbsC (Cys-tRNA(Pro) deacylase)|nr:YbaK/EbsC family protein [Rhizobiaceae bacterium]